MIRKTKKNILARALLQTKMIPSSRKQTTGIYESTTYQIKTLRRESIKLGVVETLDTSQSADDQTQITALFVAQFIQSRFETFGYQNN
ncbi:hypothetical protein J6590_056098 [Homalodisca vitripennis]|nr:hypothetical protein J6590_056098 [Homalodisca vitripennis]